MPEWLEKQLAREADKKGLTGKRKQAYIYGGLRRYGWKPKRRKTVKKSGKR